MERKYARNEQMFIGYYIMKFSKYLLGLALCVMFGMMWSCQKEDDKDGNPAALPTLTLPASLVIPYESRDTTVTIDASSGTWEVSSEEKWLKFTPNTEQETLRIQIEENKGTTIRTADVRIVIKDFDVEGVLPVVQEVKPSLVITPSANVDVLADEGETTLSVSLSAGEWTAVVSEGEAWLSVQKSSADELKVKYSAYTDTDSRTGTVKVSVNALSSVSQDITVTQSAPTKILLSGSEVQNNSIEVSEASGAVTVNVQLVGPSGVEWSAVAEDDPDWVTITTNATAGTFTITYQQNDNRVYRLALINVRAMPKAGDITQSLFIEQKGLITADPPELDFTKTSTWKFEIPSSAQTLNFSSTVDPSSFTASPTGAATKGTHDAAGNILPMSILSNSSVARTITVTMTEGSHTIVLQLLQASPVSIRVLGEDVSEGVITIEKDAVTDRDFDVEVIGATTWTVESYEGTWLTPAPANNNGQLSISAAASTERVYRTGSITIEAGGVTQEIRVEQAGDIASTSALPTLDFTMPGMIKMDISSEEQTLNFPSAENPSFSVVPRAAASKGNFDGSVLSIEIAANGPDSRTIEVTLLEVNVIQIILIQEPKISIELTNASDDNVITLEPGAGPTNFAVTVEGTEVDWTVALTSAGAGSWLAAVRSGSNVQLTTASSNTDRGYRRDAVITIEADGASKAFTVEQKGLKTSTTYPQLSFTSNNIVKMEATEEMQTFTFPTTHDPSAGFSVNLVGAVVPGTYDATGGKTFTMTLQENTSRDPRTVEVEMRANANIVTLVIFQDEAVGIDIAGVEEDVVVLAQVSGSQDFDVNVTGTTSTWSVKSGSVISGSGATAWLSATKETSGKLRLTTASNNAEREYRMDGSFVLEVNGVERTFRVEQRGDHTQTPAALPFPATDGETQMVKIEATGDEQIFTLDGFTVSSGFQSTSVVADPFSLTDDPPQANAATTVKLTLAENPLDEARTVRAVLTNSDGTTISSVEFIVEQQGNVIFSIEGVEGMLEFGSDAVASQDFTLSVSGPGTTGATFSVTDPTTGGSADWLAATLQGSDQVRLVVDANTNRAFRFSSFTVTATASDGSTVLGSQEIHAEQRGDIEEVDFPELDFGVGGAERIKIEATSAAQTFNFPSTGNLQAAATISPANAATVPEMRDASNTLPIRIASNTETEERLITIIMRNSNTDRILEIVQQPIIAISVADVAGSVITLNREGRRREYEVTVEGTTDAWSVTKTGEWFTAQKSGDNMLVISGMDPNNDNPYRRGSVTISTGGVSRTFDVEQMGNPEADLPTLDFRTSNTVKISFSSGLSTAVDLTFNTVGLDATPILPNSVSLIVSGVTYSNGEITVSISSGQDQLITIPLNHEGKIVTLVVPFYTPSIELLGARSIQTQADGSVAVVEGSNRGYGVILLNADGGEKRFKVRIGNSDQDWYVEQPHPSNSLTSARKVGDELVLTFPQNTVREYGNPADLNLAVGEYTQEFTFRQEGAITANPADLHSDNATVNITISATAEEQELVFGGATSDPTVSAIMPANAIAKGTYDNTGNSIPLELTANSSYTTRSVEVRVTVGSSITNLVIFQQSLLDVTVGGTASGEVIPVPQAGLTGDARTVIIRGAPDWDYEVETGSWLTVNRNGHDLEFTASANANRAYRTTTLTIIVGRERVMFTIEQAGNLSEALPTLDFTSNNRVKIAVPTGAAQDLQFTGVSTAPTPSNQMPSSSDISMEHSGSTLTISLSENSDAARTLSIDLTSGGNTVTLEILQEPSVTIAIADAVAQEGGNDLIQLANAATADARTLTISGASLRTTNPIDATSVARFVTISGGSNMITFTPGAVLTTREYGTGTFTVYVTAANPAAQANAPTYYQKTFDIEQIGDVTQAPEDLDFSTASTIKMAMPNGDADDLEFGGVTADPTAGTVDPAGAATESWTNPNLTITVNANDSGEERMITFPFTGTGSSATETITLVIVQPSVEITVTEANADNVIEVTAGATSQAVTVSFSGSEEATLSITDPRNTWITAATPLTGGSGVVMDLTLQANADILYRTQDIEVSVGNAMKTFTLEQAGNPEGDAVIGSSTTRYVLSSDATEKIALSGARSSLTITFTESLVAPNVPTLNTTSVSGASADITGTYNSDGTFVLSIPVNTAAARELTAVIDQGGNTLTLTIMQTSTSGITVTVGGQSDAITGTEEEAADGEADFLVDVQGTGLAWTVADDSDSEDWVTEAEKSSNNIRFNYDANAGILYRTQEFGITVGGGYTKTFTLEQEGDPDGTPMIGDSGTPVGLSGNSTEKIALSGVRSFFTIAFATHLDPPATPVLNAAGTSGGISAAYDPTFGDFVLNIPPLVLNIPPNTNMDRELTAVIEDTNTPANTLTITIFQTAVSISITAEDSGVIPVTTAVAADGEADFTVDVGGTDLAWTVADGAMSEDWVTKAIQSPDDADDIRFNYNVNSTIIYRTQVFGITVGNYTRNFVLEQAGDPSGGTTIDMNNTPFNVGDNSLKIAVPAAQTDITLTFATGLTVTTDIPARVDGDSDDEVTEENAYESTGGTLVLRVAQNTSTERTLTVVIADTNTSAKKLTITIVQEGSSS